MTTLNNCTNVPWSKIEPPLWWDKIGEYIIADRHLPCGTRQHMVKGKVKSELVVANAQIIGDDDLTDFIYSDKLSHLSNTVNYIL